ncbi:uncharacterized protein PFLUO_LOCUS9510 [Penicillium psychrofluorescens]|uniref:uncharacterized protein n=1 Tax=Penicillium psychrofluorescens TaxID=3158075 RepID=UPI003CCDFE4F
MTWLGSTPSAVLYINSTNAEIPGGVELWIAETSDFINSRYKAASLPSSFSGLKTAVAESGDIHFLVHGQSHSNGTPYNEKLVTTSLSSARIYDSIYVRHWDTWLTPTFNAVFSGTLRKTNIKERASIYYHMREPLNNLVAGVKNLESPSPPFGGSSDYDISPNGKLVAFKSKAPELPRANHTASYIYLASHDGSHDPVAINGPHSAYTPAGIRGDSSGPAFSPDSRQLAYFQMEDIFYESDRRTLYVYTIGSQEIIPSVAKNWDRSPDTVKWTRDGQSLIVGCEDKARSRLFHIPASAPDSFVFADQGYVVVAPNPTGSSGFGEELTDMIQNNWGGYPYEDLEKCWEYVRDNFEFVDTEHGVAVGASFGGFMINWIQGNPLGRKFKALVTHDGTFVADAKISTDELWFMEHDFNGTFWANRDNYRRWDPSAPEHILQFGTPHLIVHSSNDYRLPIAEGLSLFNVLQERGVPSRLLNFPDENHWVTDPENSLVWHQQVLGWLNRYSGLEESNPSAVSLDDTVVPVVNYNP